MSLTSIELCAGAGGQALGLERAGFEHLAVIEIDKHACSTLRHNRPQWNVQEADVTTWSDSSLYGIDLVAGGVPCPPFSRAGQQLGSLDERDLFPAAIRVVSELQPRAVMLENVRGLLDPRFDAYRLSIQKALEGLGYVVQWKLLQAADFGVPQLRPRVFLIALDSAIASDFSFPEPIGHAPPTVGESLLDLMAARGWVAAHRWAADANGIAPTLVGGSKKHGGADLGPTRARQAWAQLGVNGKSIANEAPDPGFEGMPRLTVRMAARIQGFPDEWEFQGRKTAAYRQVGNALPPPLATAVGESLARVLELDDVHQGVA